MYSMRGLRFGIMKRDPFSYIEATNVGERMAHRQLQFDDDL